MKPLLCVFVCESACLLASMCLCARVMCLYVGSVACSASLLLAQFITHLHLSLPPSLSPSTSYFPPPSLPPSFPPSLLPPSFLSNVSPPIPQPLLPPSLTHWLPLLSSRPPVQLPPVTHFRNLPSLDATLKPPRADVLSPNPVRDDIVVGCRLWTRCYRSDFLYVVGSYTF